MSFIDKYQAGFWVLGFTFLFSWFLYSGLKKSKEMLKWPVVKGTITTSEIVKIAASTPQGTYMIKYEYQVDGKSYTNSTVEIAAEPRNVDECKKYVERFPKGRVVDVYFNPRKPKESILLPGGDEKRFLREIRFSIFVGLSISAAIFVYTGIAK